MKHSLAEAILTSDSRYMDWGHQSKLNARGQVVGMMLLRMPPLPPSPIAMRTRQHRMLAKIMGEGIVRL